MILQAMYTALSLPADDASMLVVRHITDMLLQKTPRLEAWAAQTTHGRTRLSFLSGLQCAAYYLHVVMSEFLSVQSIVVGFAPALLSLHTIPDARHRVASANLAQARAEARTFGGERRAAIRARVTEFEQNKGREEPSS
jgi:hypothetical protein